VPNTNDPKQAVDAIFGHTCSVYEAMFERATRVPIDGLENQYMVVYEGRLVNLVTQELYLSVPYYSRVTQLLKKMGCARQLKRGGGSSNSQWELVKEPTLEDYLALVEKEPDLGKTGGAAQRGPKAAEFEALSQQVRDLHKLYLEVKQQNDQILQFLKDHFGTESNDD
jgi:hypothetical protein